jgi:hypothetical protein
VRIELVAAQGRDHVARGRDRHSADVDERPNEQQLPQVILGVISLIRSSGDTRFEEPFAQVVLDRRHRDAAACAEFTDSH